SDMSELQRLGLLDQAKRAAAGETKASGDGLVYKTHAPVRALLSDDPQPATDAVDHAPFDFYAWLDARLTQEREFIFAAIGEALGEYVAKAISRQRRDAKLDLDNSVRSLKIELAELQITLAQLREVMAASGKSVDAPTMFSRRVN